MIRQRVETAASGSNLAKRKLTVQNTLADLASSETIQPTRLAEAMQYRPCGVDG